jgi:hypothetical protein
MLFALAFALAGALPMMGALSSAPNTLTVGFFNESSCSGTPFRTTEFGNGECRHDRAAGQVQNYQYRCNAGGDSWIYETWDLSDDPSNNCTGTSPQWFAGGSVHTCIEMNQPPRKFGCWIDVQCNPTD